MLQQFINQSFWAFALEAAVFIGIISKISILIHYHRLLGETRQMEQIHTKWVRALKKRFDGYSQLNFRVENSAVFVDKYMEMDRICGLKSRVYVKIPAVCMLLIALSACQGREDWIFGIGINIAVAFLMAELLLDSKAFVPEVRTNLLLSIEKGTVKKKKKVEKRPRIERRKMEEEVALSKEEELSPEEMEIVGRILKEWWDF